MAADNNDKDSTQPLSQAQTSADAMLRLRQELYLGVTLKDRYLIERELARGGIGIVFLAQDKQLLSRQVVVKILLEEMAGSEHRAWLMKKFSQEIEALARIDHPGVVGVFDAGQLDDGKPYLVMQYVEGRSLRSAMDAGKSDFRQVADIVRQIGQALSAAHDKGVVHRDLKPENIMLQTLGEGEEIIKLIDFGIAQVTDSQISSPERTRIAGAMPYMASEQLKGKPSAASDIYALGVIAYEMLTGSLPFYPGTMVELYEMQQLGVQVRPRELCPDLPPAAEQAILRALSFAPDQRPRRAREFGEELARALTANQTAASGTSPAETADSSGVVASFRTQTLEPEMAHVLFTDLVGYSKLPMDQQTQYLGELQQVVNATSEVARARERNQLISLPTGDGMALAFFGDPAMPVRCALEIAGALLSLPHLRLRMGINGGPVHRVADINANRNVAGGGINLAQRVMDCGDAGHILLSNVTAELVQQTGLWTDALHDLGEQEVKHGVRVHLHNLWTGELGNPTLPEKLAKSREEKTAALHAEQEKTAALRAEQEKPEARHRVPWLIAVAVLVIGGLLAALLWSRTNHDSGQQTTGTPTVAPPLALSYSITVQRYRDGKPSGSPFTIPGGLVIENGSRVHLNLTTAQDGHLYLLNEGPELKNGLPDYNLLFPTPNTNSGSAQLRAAQTLRLPNSSEFVLDNQEGTEKIWLIWSPGSVTELEAVKPWANDRDKGEIKDAAQTRTLQEFFRQHESAAKAETEQSDQQTKLKSRNGLFVHLLRLEHR